MIDPVVSSPKFLASKPNADREAELWDLYQSGRVRFTVLQLGDTFSVALRGSQRFGSGGYYAFSRVYAAAECRPEVALIVDGSTDFIVQENANCICRGRFIGASFSGDGLGNGRSWNQYFVCEG